MFKELNVKKKWSSSHHSFSTKKRKVLEIQELFWGGWGGSGQLFADFRFFAVDLGTQPSPPRKRGMGVLLIYVPRVVVSGSWHGLIRFRWHSCRNSRLPFLTGNQTPAMPLPYFCVLHNNFVGRGDELPGDLQQAKALHVSLWFVLCASMTVKMRA